MQFKDDPRSAFLLMHMIQSRCRHEKLRCPTVPWLDSQNVVHDMWHFNMIFNGEVAGWRTQMQNGIRVAALGLNDEQ